MKNKNKLLHCFSQRLIRLWRKIVTLLQKYPDRDLTLLISHAIKKNKEFVLAHQEYNLSFGEYLKLRYYIYLRRKNYPLAYIIKHKEFYGLDFYINKHVLVPRPETEMMVDEVTYNMKHVTHNKTLLVDIGTGSGCIPISILKQINTSTNKQINTYAIDISRSALRVAKKNTQRYNVDIKFLHGNLLEPIIKNCYMFDVPCSMIITANLPYLTNNQFKNESSIQHEPKIALISDSQDGLKLYDKLLSQINHLIKCYILNITCYLEIDPSQFDKIKTLINEHFPQAKITIKKDLAGLDRLVRLDLSTTNN